MTFLDIRTRLSAFAFSHEIATYAESRGWHVRIIGHGLLIFVRRPRVVFAIVRPDRGPLSIADLDWYRSLLACKQEVHIFRPRRQGAVEEILH